MARKPNPEPRPKTEAEAAFYDEATEAGWRVTRRGWPDFFLSRYNPETEDVEVALVEVTGKRGRRLKSEQRRILKLLATYGVPVFQWTEGKGMEPIPPF